MRIKMPRGDIKNIRFYVTDSLDEMVPVDFDEIFFTVKKTFKERKFIFQKKLSDGTIERDDEGYYHFVINPDDTNYLDYGKYVFDIEVLLDNVIKHTSIGNFILTEEVTHYMNEDDNDKLYLNIGDNWDNIEERQVLNIKLDDYIFKFSTNYEDLDNKPQINSVELIGNKSLDELNIQKKGDYASTPLSNSEIEELLD